MDTNEPKDAFEVSPELKAILLESIAQCDRGQTISAEQLFDEMRNRESAALDVPSAKPA